MAQSTNTDQQLAEIMASVKEKNLPPLLSREFVTVDTGAASGETIRIMQWNMLAQGLSQNVFAKCPPAALDLNVRKLRIVEEILRFQPMVVCLEEVDQFSFLSETLNKSGYQGMFKAKPASPCLDHPINYGPDGCAIFYNASNLELLNCDKIVLKAWGQRTNQVAIVCLFRTKSKSPKDFTVAVTHLKAGYQSRSNCEDIRKEQALFLTTYLKKNHSKFPLFVSGDFNFPSSESGYEVMKSCDLGLSSAYTSLSADGQEPYYTFWTITDMELRKSIDFIWYTKKGSKVKSILNKASEDEVGPGRLPSLKYPSDHISLVCDFILLDADLGHEEKSFKNESCECL